MARGGVSDMKKRRFIQLGGQSAVLVAALFLGLSPQRAPAQNRTGYDKSRLFRGFKNNNDLIFQGFAYHAFHNGLAPRIVQPDGGYTYFIDSFVGNVIPQSARIKTSTPRIEPGYWLVAVKLDEIYNTGIDVERFRGLRLDVFDFAIEMNAKVDLAESTGLTPEMKYFIWGIKAFMDKYSTTSRHSNRDSISDEDIEQHFMTSIYFAAYRDHKKTDEQIIQAVDDFMRSAIPQRNTLAIEVFEALAQLGSGDEKSTDPDDPYNRRYVASWSSYMIGTKIAVYQGDMEKSLLLETNVEVPLRRFVARIRPDTDRGETVLKF
jgi:hypothetical protein